MKFSAASFLTALAMVLGSAAANSCVCLTGGCDQTGCGPGAICPFGGCIQDGLESPNCALGWCSQVDAVNPVCGAGFCDQVGTQNPVCGAGFCCQKDATNPVSCWNCLNGEFCMADSNQAWMGIMEQYVPEQYQNAGNWQDYASNWQDGAWANGDWISNIPEQFQNVGNWQQYLPGGDSNMDIGAQAMLADSNWEQYVNADWNDYIPDNVQDWQSYVNTDWANQDWTEYDGDWSQWTTYDSNAEKFTRFSTLEYSVLSNSDNWESFTEDNFGYDDCLCIVGGCDQAACGPGAQCIGGRCTQSGLMSPSCLGGSCYQVAATEPSCLGGNCVQDLPGPNSCPAGNCYIYNQTSDPGESLLDWYEKVGVNEAGMSAVDRPLQCDCWGGRCDQRGCPAYATCLGGGCNQKGLENPSCIAGNCCQDDAIDPLCFGGGCYCAPFNMFDSNMELTADTEAEPVDSEPAGTAVESAGEEIDSEAASESSGSFIAVGTGAGLLLGAAALL